MTFSRAVLMARLAVEYPAYFRAWQEGLFKSVAAAAEAAGLIKTAREPLARLKRNWKKASAAERREFLKYVRDNRSKKGAKK